ncbi:MAG: RNA methyltransferase [Pirellulaceae bacterium]|nr:RNA methyltransferase [Planctomycetales bacterium]
MNPTDWTLVNDLSDHQLDPFRDLRHRNPTRWSGTFIAEGYRVVQRLIASDLEVQSVLVSHRRLSSMQDLLAGTHRKIVVPQPIAEQLVGYNFHAGVLACGRRPPADPATVDWQATKHWIVLPGTQLPDNLGSIIRLGAAFGVDGVVLGPRSADPWSRRAVRVSMGNIFSISIIEMGDICQFLEDISHVGFATIAAAISSEATPLTQLVPPDRWALVLGNEADGLDDAILRRCTHAAVVPMRHGVDSLNVSDAAAVFLYHLTR